MPTKNQRFEKGWGKLKQIDGQAGEQVVKALEDICPDLARYIIEYSFGDIYCRDGLDLMSKELAVVAALTAMGTAEPQLKVHINGALNVGCSINQVTEVILQMLAYAGFPACLNAMDALKEVLEKRRGEGINDQRGDAPSAPAPAASRYELGAKALDHLVPGRTESLHEAYDGLSPDITRLAAELGYAEIHCRPGLDIKHRQIATIAALTALGNAKPQLKFHIEGGLNIGLGTEQIAEIMLLMTVYAGFPAAINGTDALKEVLKERG